MNCGWPKFAAVAVLNVAATSPSSRHMLSVTGAMSGHWVWIESVCSAFIERTVRPYVHNRVVLGKASVSRTDLIAVIYLRDYS